MLVGVVTAAEVVGVVTAAMVVAVVLPLRLTGSFTLLEYVLKSVNNFSSQIFQDGLKMQI